MIWTRLYSLKDLIYQKLPEIFVLIWSISQLERNPCTLGKARKCPHGPTNGFEEGNRDIASCAKVPGQGM